MQSTSRNPMAAAEILRAQLDREDAARERDRILESRGYDIRPAPGSSTPNRRSLVHSAPPVAPPSRAPASDGQPATPDITHPPRPFTPSPAQADTLLSELAADDLTLRDIAEQHNTSLDALNLWLMRPDIDARLAAMTTVCAKRTRLIASNRSVHIARILGRLLDAHDEFESLDLIQPDALPPDAKQRARESARKACNLLLRLTTFHPRASASGSTNPERSEGPSASPKRQRESDSPRSDPNEDPSHPKPLDPSLHTPDLLQLRECRLQSPRFPRASRTGEEDAQDSTSANAPPAAHDHAATPAHALLTRAGTVPWSSCSTPPDSSTPPPLHSSSPPLARSPPALPALRALPSSFVPLTISAHRPRPP